MKFMFRTLASAILLAAALWSAEKAPAKKSAFDKATLEAYVRHLNVWGPQIKVEIDNPKPSPLPGFEEVAVHASAGSPTGRQRLENRRQFQDGWPAGWAASAMAASASDDAGRRPCARSDGGRLRSQLVKPA